MTGRPPKHAGNVIFFYRGGKTMCLKFESLFLYTYWEISY